MPGIGSQIQRYKILSQIGKGGMGEVFLASDTRLERNVALKILPEELSSRPQRIHRFVQEAKSASALNHPNIVTIHEIGEENGIHFITSEFIEGKTLNDRFSKNSPTIREVLDVSVQIASALTAAHKAGIVHRDIKPENIMIREDGLVKILDFGLAKLLESSSEGEIDQEAETRAQVITQAGRIMGTMPYVSPEQARGKEVDTRSDIWSFGVVLYELLCGERPFQGETPSDTIAAILKTEPPPISSYGLRIPKALEKILGKTLNKEKLQRYQHAGDLQLDLQDLKEELTFESRSEESTTQILTQEMVAPEDSSDIARKTTTAADDLGAMSTVDDQEYKRSLNFKTIVMTSLGAIALVASLAIVFSWYSQEDVDDPFQRMRLVKLTSNANAVEFLVAVSPDGKYVAYVSRDGDKQGLRLRQVAIDSNVDILEPDNVSFKGLGISPEGDFVFYVTGTIGAKGDLYKVPILGGTPRMVMKNVDNAVAFGPDGNSLAMIRDTKSVFVSDNEGNQSRELAKLEDDQRWITLSWSNDGKKIAASAHSMTDSNVRLLIIDVASGSIETLPGPAWLRISGLDWLDGDKGIVISGRDLETEMSQLWSISYPDGRRRRITNDLSSYTGVDISRGGNELVTVQFELESNIWISTDDGTQAVKRITTEQGKRDGMSGIAKLPEDAIVYTIRERGNNDLWISSKGAKKQLTKNAGSNFSPAVSRDGKHLIFVSTRSGNVNLWKTDLNGQAPIELTNDPGIEGAPNISPDGKSVVYQVTDKSNKTTIWKMNLDGGQPEQITKVESGWPVYSPDGKWIACEFEKTKDKPMIALIPSEGGEPESLYEFPEVLKTRGFKWTEDSKGLLYVGTTAKVGNIFRQNISGGPPTQVTSFDKDQIFRFDVSYEDGGFVMARGRMGSDVVMLKQFQ